MARAIDFPRRGQQQGRTIFAFGRVFADEFDRVMQMAHEGRLHHKVLGRIARQDQFRIQNHVRSLFGRSFPGSHNLVPVPGDITDNRVELGNRNGKLLCHDVGIGSPLRAVNCGMRNIPCFRQDHHSCMAEMQSLETCKYVGFQRDFILINDLAC